MILTNIGIKAQVVKIQVVVKGSVKPEWSGGTSDILRMVDV